MDGMSGLPAGAPLFLLLLGLCLYFLPAIVATAREHHNAASVFVLNLLLGWTFIGWVIAMVWAVMAVATAASAPRREQGGVTVTLTEEQARKLGIGREAGRGEE